MTKKNRQTLTEKAALKSLALLWQELNDTHFLGNLKKCPKFIISKKVKYLAAYSFSWKGRKIFGTQIIMSHQLFYHAPQKIFIDALLHEMAHQFCIEVLNLKNEEHGKIWQLICKAIGANPAPQSFWRITTKFS